MQGSRPMGELQHVVVVGASLAGSAGLRNAAAEGFRRRDHAGRGRAAPALRPAAAVEEGAGRGRGTADQIQLRRPEQLAELGLEFRLGAAATSLDTDGAAGPRSPTARASRYDGLIIATGASVRRLPGQPDAPRHLRAAHARRLARAARRPRRRLAPGGRDRRRIHRARGGRDGPQARARGHRARRGVGAALIRGLGAEMGDLVARSCTVPRGRASAAAWASSASSGATG